MVLYVDAVVAVTVIRVILFVLYVCMLRECEGARVTAMLVWGKEEVVSSNHLFHSSAHCFPTTFNIIMSSKEQGCPSWEHCNMCAVVSYVLPQAHVVSPV